MTYGELQTLLAGCGEVVSQMSTLPDDVRVRYVLDGELDHDPYVYVDIWPADGRRDPDEYVSVKTGLSTFCQYMLAQGHDVPFTGVDP